MITKTTNIASFCKIQHMKYIAHVTRLDNDAIQKQLLFTTNHQKYSCNKWTEMEKELKICKTQIQKMMQTRKVHVPTISSL